MFKWHKSNGCDCHPIKKGCEKYLINVGDVWGGTVESAVDECEPNVVMWSSWYTIMGEKISGQSGGTDCRDEHMSFVENRILESINSVMNVYGDQTRKIFDSFCQKDENGNWFQEELT